jgi:hypothetical protein
MKAATKGALGLVVVAIIAAVAGIAEAKINHPDPPKTIVTFNRLVPLAHHKGVSAAAGFAAEGSVTNLPEGDSLWLMDRDDVSYTIDQQATVSGEVWTAVSVQVGDPGQKLPFGINAAIVQATSACAGKLRQAIQEEKDTFPGLPEGCIEMASRQVRVIEP